jgi:hypothetical protein
MGRPLSGASAPKGSRPAIDRFTPQSERQFPKTEDSSTTEAVAAPVAPQSSVTSKVENVSEAEAVAARKKEMEQQRIETDMKAYAIKKAQKDIAAKLAQRKK